MRKDEIPQECIMLSCFHRHGNDIDYFRGFGAKQCTPHDLSAMVVYNCFQHAVCLFQRARTYHRSSRQTGNLKRISSFQCFFFGKSDMSQRRVDKYGIRNRVTISDVPFLVSEKLVADDPEII